MKAKKHPITAITLVCALLLNHIAFADDPTQENVDQIIVTGARTPLNINQLGSASTIITRSEIEQREARHVSDLLRSTCQRPGNGR